MIVTILLSLRAACISDSRISTISSNSNSCACAHFNNAMVFLANLLPNFSAAMEFFSTCLATSKKNFRSFLALALAALASAAANFLAS